MATGSEQGVGKVVIGYCHPDQVSGAFTGSLVRFLQFDHDHHGRVIEGGGVITMNSGPRITSARNTIVARFLDMEHRPEWLWMLDADMVFTPDALEGLLMVAHPEERPVVGGLCFAGGRTGKVVPTMYRIVDRGDDGEGAAIGTIENWPRGEPIQVDATGAACLLMHRSLLEQMRETWPGPTHWFFEGVHAGVEYGEDFGFCVRVHSLGKPVIVHTGVEVGHHKSFILDIDDFDQFVARRAVVGDEQIAADAHAKLRVGPGGPPVRPTPMNRAARRRAKRAERSA